MIKLRLNGPKYGFLLLPLSCFGFFATVVLAAEWQKDKDNALLPAIPEAQGEQCVEPTEVMRRRHMDFILHQRDETVHKGVRTEKHRFVNCVNCHVQARRTAEGKLAYPRHTDADHFCTNCHTYAMVTIDCFQCHADRPESFYQNHIQAMHAVPFEERLYRLEAALRSLGNVSQTSL